MLKKELGIPKVKTPDPGPQIFKGFESFFLSKLKSLFSGILKFIL